MAHLNDLFHPPHCAVAGGAGATRPRPHVQFRTTYRHLDGTLRLRVTTAALQWRRESDRGSQGFDQEAAAALMARVAVYRARREPAWTVVRWLDRSLVRLLSAVAGFTRDDPGSLRVPPAADLFSQFMFHLRRSPLLRMQYETPDYVAYHHRLLLGETVAHSLLMIQPSLLAYGFSQDVPWEGTPESLEPSSMRADRLLLLDTFELIVWHGDTIAAWRQQGYQSLPEHQNFKALLQAPVEDAQLIMQQGLQQGVQQGRFPVPRYVACDQHRGSARLFNARVHRHLYRDGAAAGRPPGVLPDASSASLVVFLEHLAALVVSRSTSKHQRAVRLAASP